MSARWQVHRYARSVSGPQGISYYSLSVTGSEYLSVQRRDGEWTWRIHTTRRHDAFGRAAQLGTGTAPTLAAAKAAALDAWTVTA